MQQLGSLFRMEPTIRDKLRAEILLKGTAHAPIALVCLPEMKGPDAHESVLAMPLLRQIGNGFAILDATRKGQEGSGAGYYDGSSPNLHTGCIRCIECALDRGILSVSAAASAFASIQTSNVELLAALVDKTLIGLLAYYVARETRLFQLKQETETPIDTQACASAESLAGGYLLSCLETLLDHYDPEAPEAGSVAAHSKTPESTVALPINATLTDLLQKHFYAVLRTSAVASISKNERLIALMESVSEFLAVSASENSLHRIQEQSTLLHSILALWRLINTSMKGS
jgi:hypothetical protein